MKHDVSITEISARAKAADIEVFYIDELDAEALGYRDWQGNTAPGWYHWHCLPGCLPTGDAYGPFFTQEEALEDAWTCYGLDWAYDQELDEVTE